MLPGELALRTATAAILLVTGIVLLRDRKQLGAGPFSGLLALSVAVASVGAIRVFSWLWPLQILATGTSALLWIWAGAIFDDDFRAGWRDALAWMVLPVLAVVDRYAGQRWIETAGGVLALVFVLLAAVRALTGLRDDLVERRRRLRPVMVTLAVLYAAGEAFMDVAGTGRPGGASGKVVEAALLTALALGFALLGLRARNTLPERPRPVVLQAPTIEVVDPDDALLARLV